MLTYGEVEHILTGLSLSVSGDMMLSPGKSKITHEHLVQMVTKMRENEAKIRGISTEEVYESATSEMVLHESTEKIWNECLAALDEKTE